MKIISGLFFFWASLNVFANQALFDAVSSQDLKLVESILKNDCTVDINFRSSWGDTILTRAISTCYHSKTARCTC